MCGELITNMFSKKPTVVHCVRQIHVPLKKTIKNPPIPILHLARFFYGIERCPILCS